MRWSDPRNGPEAKGSLEGPAGQPTLVGLDGKGREGPCPLFTPSTFTQVDYPLDFGSILLSLE